MIDKCLMCSSSSTNQATIRTGLCQELDKLRADYRELEEVMADQMTRKLIPELREVQRSSIEPNGLTSAKLKISMLPSVGFFIVATKSSVASSIQIKDLSSDEFE